MCNWRMRTTYGDPTDTCTMPCAGSGGASLHGFSPKHYSYIIKQGGAPLGG